MVSDIRALILRLFGTSLEVRSANPPSLEKWREKVEKLIEQSRKTFQESVAELDNFLESPKTSKGSDDSEICEATRMVRVNGEALYNLLLLSTTYAKKNALNPVLEEEEAKQILNLFGKALQTVTNEGFKKNIQERLSDVEKKSRAWSSTP